MAQTEFIQIILPEQMDLATAAPLARSLLAVRGQPIALDASKVKKIGGLCLQVLISAHITWKADNIPARIEHPSASFKDALAVFGAFPILNAAVNHV